MSGVTQVYTTTFGRTYYIFRQDDPRWKNVKTGNSTWGETGCFLTSYVTVANSYSNKDNYSPPKSVSASWLREGKDGHLNLHRTDAGCSGSNADKIKCIITEKGGAVVVHSCDKKNGVDRCWDNGNHYFPIIDYKVENGTEYYFLANTIAGGGARFRQGWVRKSEIDAVAHKKYEFFQPITPVNCNN